MLGELGAPWAARGSFDATFRAVESNVVQAALVWCYCPKHGDNDGWNGEDFSIVSGNALRLPGAVRPYACRVAGRATRMEWNDGVFVLEFVEDGDCLSTATEIFLPELHFPCGALGVEASDGEWSFDCGLLTFRHAPALGGVHWVKVARADVLER